MTVVTLPAVLAILTFECFLGHRHDYSGHFAAGYGATLGAAMFALRIVDVAKYRSQLTWMIVPFCILCIGGGAVAEATAFRIAKFDEVDFCNQSLGAVLATLCSIPFLCEKHENTELIDGSLVIGIAFLGIGGVLAAA